MMLPSSPPSPPYNSPEAPIILRIKPKTLAVAYKGFHGLAPAFLS